MSALAHMLTPVAPPQWQGPTRRHSIATPADLVPMRNTPPGPKPSSTRIPVAKQRRADLEAILREGKVERADDLARRLKVSVRGIYRDIAKLRKGGLAVEGEAGVGYQLRGTAC
jgi:biotin operon repressor